MRRSDGRVLPALLLAVAVGALAWWSLSSSGDGGELATGRDASAAPVDGPRAVIPGAAGSVDLVCELLPPERLAALPSQAERYSGLRDPASPYLARPRFALFEAERLLAFEPDLVLAHSWQSVETVARLREAGVEVLEIEDPADWDGLVALVERLGEALGSQEAAERLLARCEVRRQALAARRADRPELTALAYSNGGTGGWMAGAGTTNHEILRLAGLRNLAADRDGHVQVSFEELLVMDPDVLVVGSPADAQEPGGTLELLRNEPALAGLRAVAEDRLVVLDSWLYTTLSQHLLDAAEEVLDQLEAFEPPR